MSTDEQHVWRSNECAPEGQAVMTKIEDADGCRNEQILVRNGNLWFAGDMYVYYYPTHWRELSQIEKLRLKNESERKAIDSMERSIKTLGLS